MTTGLWILLCAALLLLAFNLLRVGVDAAYDGETLFLRVKAGPVRLTILPKKEKPPKPPKEKKEKKPGKTAKKPKEKKKLTVSTLLKLARYALEALSALRQKLQADLLRLHLRVGTSDPYNTAMYYAYLQSAVYGLSPLVERTLIVKTRDVQLSPDFTGEQISADARLILTLRIGQIVLVALVLAWRALWTILRQPKKRKASKDQRKSKAEAPSAERTEPHG